jgi:hypothetical protein
MFNEKSRENIVAFGLPILVLFIISFIFGLDSGQSLYSVMSLSFIFFLPFIAGALTVYLSRIERVRLIGYRIFAPWITILCFFIYTVAFSFEGWACWLMILPFFLVISSIGGLYSGYIKLNQAKKYNQLNISLLILLPFLTTPLEQMLGSIPGKFEAYTSIEIHSSPDKIWNNVTRVREIKQEQDKGRLTNFLGFPRPIKAELNFDGAGATREAIFSGGLVFHEKVLSYEQDRKMNFSIKAFPYEIPSTTMDEHVVIGGNYFDVLDGTYELQKLDSSTCLLILYSHFKLSTNFNFYASWWAGLIMKDIQNNILQVIKQRAEHEKNAKFSVD